MRHKRKQLHETYSRFLVRFAWIILISSLMLTMGLTITLVFRMKIRPFDQTNFHVRNGRTWKNIQRIEQLFGNDKEYRVHQQMDLYPALDLIIKRRSSSSNDTNMLNVQIIDELHSLDHQIRSIHVPNPENSTSLNYSSLCAFVNHACMVDGNYLLSSKFREDATHLPYIRSGIYIDSSSATNGIAAFIFGKNYQVINTTSTDVVDYQDDEEAEEEEEDAMTTPASLTEIISYVPIFRLRYALNISNDRMRSMAIQWERDVLHYLTEEFHSDSIIISASTSTAISDSITKQAHKEGPFMAIMLLIFFILVCFVISIQGSSHTSVGYLSVCGMISLALSSGATFGLLSICGIDLIEPMALTIFVIASKIDQC